MTARAVHEIPNLFSAGEGVKDDQLSFYTQIYLVVLAAPFLAAFEDCLYTKP
jgi:hypothetical protein